jgi:nucleoside phosphorylase
MEGGAFFYCCLKSKVPFIEIRAISNIVATRNREAWNIPLAVGNLTLELQPILQFFSGV